MRLSQEQYARKRIHNGCLVRIENSVTRDNRSASFSKPRDAEQLPSRPNFQFAQPLKILILLPSNFKHTNNNVMGKHKSGQNNRPQR